MSARKVAIPGTLEQEWILHFTIPCTVGLLPSNLEEIPLYRNLLELHRGDQEKAMHAYIEHHLKTPHILNEMPGTTGPAVVFKPVFHDLEDLPPRER